MSANADANDIDLDLRVRRNLRQLRQEQGLTLQQVAERAHVDVSTLSRLEAGKRRLTLEHLPGLASALGVTVDDLLGPAPTAPDPRIHAAPIRRDDLTMWPLTHREGHGGLHPYKVRISARRRRPPATLGVHEGYDWLYVIHGKLRLLLGDDDLIIGPGEAVEFGTWTPHWFGAVDGPVELLALFGPQGDRLHLHGGEQGPGAAG
jgi:transcriptional regulator with XRE-family HTH domain